MGRLTKRILPTAFAIAAGLTVLVGYLIPIPQLIILRDQLIRWAIVIAAFAFILGFFNILRVNLNRTIMKKQGGAYKTVLVLSALVSLVVTAAGLTQISLARSISDWWFRYVLSPLQASAAALIALALGLAAFRLLRSRRNASTVLFLLAGAIVSLGILPLTGAPGKILAQLRQWWLDVPATAGMRGFLIGVGLGTVLIGIRVVLGIDRPHSDV